jgi:hypothetical protein
VRPRVVLPAAEGWTIRQKAASSAYAALGIGMARLRELARNREVVSPARRLAGSELRLVGMEIEDDDFLALARTGFPLTPADGVNTGLSQHRVPAEDSGRLHRAVGGDHGFDFHGSPDPHFLGQRWIDRDDLRHHFALALGLVLLGAGDGVRGKQDCCAHSQYDEPYPQPRKWG